MPRRRTAGLQGLVLALVFAAFASAVWIPAAPPGDRWKLTTIVPSLSTGIYEVIQYVDCSANIASALALNVFATATLGNITGSNLRLMVHTSLDGVNASVRLTDTFGRAKDSTVSSLLAAEKCPDIAVDLVLDPTLVYTLAITVHETAGYSESGPQPHFDLIAVGIDQTTPSPTSSQSSPLNTTPQPQDSSSSSPSTSPGAASASRTPVPLIAGLVAGGLVLLALAVFMFVFCRRRRRRLRRGSWISDINGAGPYDPPSARPQWLTYDNIPTVTSTAPLMSSTTDYRSSTPVQSHASMAHLSRTSEGGQPSLVSLPRLSASSAVSSPTRPISGHLASAPPERDSLSQKDPSSLGITTMTYNEAPPAYGPPETEVPTLRAHCG